MSTPHDSIKSSFAKPHSPLPWKQTALIVRSQDGNQIAHCTRWNSGTPEPYEAEANAAFIVRACNAHDELLAYAKFEQQIETFDCPHEAEDRCQCGKRFQDLCARASTMRDAAIAKAEGR